MENNTTKHRECFIKKERKTIKIIIGLNTTLTELRSFISKNKKYIKAVQEEMREKNKIESRKKEKDFLKLILHERVCKLYNKSKKELIEMIKDNEARELSRETSYKAELVAKVINQDIYSNEIYGELKEQKKMTADNVRQIISRERAKLK